MTDGKGAKKEIDREGKRKTDLAGNDGRWEKQA